MDKQQKGTQLVKSYLRLLVDIHTEMNALSFVLFSVLSFFFENCNYIISDKRNI